MQTWFSWSKFGIIGLAIASIGLAGCPPPQSLATSATNPDVASSTISTKSTETAIANSPPQTVTYDVCGAIPDWERLSLEEQTAALRANPRYGAELETPPLQDLFEKFWNESLITFTTYGLSARTEPIYLSGVWTGIDAMAACYEGDRPAAINAGRSAEMWLIGYEVVDFVWTGETYQVTVEPTSRGLQFIQFERTENQLTLPIVVLENNGDKLTVASGDW